MSAGGNSRPAQKYARPFEIRLRVARAKQLWSGRRASDQKSFIPGAIDFALSIKQIDLESIENGQLSKSISNAFSAVDSVLDSWDATLRNFEKANHLEVRGAELKKLRPELVRVSFESAIARRLAKVIQRFDQLAVEGAAADRFARDLAIDPRPHFGGTADKAARRIRAVIILAPGRPHPAQTPVSDEKV